MWDSRLLFPLVKEPALVAINVRHHYKVDWTWPAPTSWPLSWIYGPRSSLRLPKSARLKGPYSVGGSGGLQSDFEGLVLVNSEDDGEDGAGLHVYAIDPSRASYEGANDMALVWEIDLMPLAESAIEASGLLTKASAARIVDMRVSDPGVIVSIQLSGGHGMVVEIWLNGTVRWSSSVLAMLPETTVPSLDVAIVLGASSNDELGAEQMRQIPPPGRELSALGRDSGAEIWTHSCIECKVESLDNKAVLIIDQPLEAIESLRLIEISTGKIIWHASHPDSALSATLCALPSLTATDIILACTCDYKNATDSSTGIGICSFAFHIASGKIHWASLISHDAQLPEGTVSHELRPKIYHGDEELAIISLSHELVAVKTEQGEVAWRFPLPQDQEMVGWNHLEVRSGLLIFRTTARSTSMAPGLEGGLFAIDPERGAEVWHQPASLSFPPTPPNSMRTALAPPGVLIIDSCYYIDGQSNEIQCCLDAHSELTGNRLWTQCFDQTAACDLARRRALLSVCIEWILLLQVLTVLITLVCLFLRSFLTCFMCCIWLHPVLRSVAGHVDDPAAELLLHLPDDVEGGSGDLEGGSGGSRNWDGVPLLVRGLDHPQISSHELVLAWMGESASEDRERTAEDEGGNLAREE